MAHRHQVDVREIGQVRIYMMQGERSKKTGKGIKSWLSGSAPLYKEIIKTAKQDGLLNATAHHTHYGFSGNGNVESGEGEIPNKALNLYVELIGPRDELELFCRKHGSLLKGKVVLYKHIEHWEISARSVHAIEAAEDEYAEPETILTDEPE
ncbi:MAG: hypothetical protein HIU83_15950 [Proteobacteria bacterium]|nr:hypothetical protein [Pseudomonadota bacterium]